MRKYKVFILDWDLYRGVSWDAGNPRLAPGIWAVAMSQGMYQTYTLEAVDLDDVFRILNIDHPEDYRMRSLSTGDMVVDVEAKQAYLCCSVGWQEIGSAP